MIARLARLPLFLLLAGIGGAAMLLPAGQALVLGQRPLAAIFAQSAAAVLLPPALARLSRASRDIDGTFDELEPPSIDVSSLNGPEVTALMTEAGLL